MLHLILGRSGTGKSRWCLDKAAELAHEGRRSVLVVPEQSVYTFERETVTRLKGTLAGFAEVKSFKRLCGDILSQWGGNAAVRLDAAQKNVLVRKAVLECRDGFSFYRKKRSEDPAFYEMLSGLFDELRNAGAGPSDLDEVAVKCGSDLTARKFSDVSSVLSAYERILETGYADDAGELEKAAGKLEASGTLKGAHLFFDGFTGFTRGEFGLLAASLGEAAEVWVTLCCGDPDREAESAVGVCCRTYHQLRELSREALGREPEIIRLSVQHRIRGAGVEDAGEWFGFGGKGSGSAEGVRTFRAADMYAEAEAAAAEIARLVREEGYRYGEIDVAVRDTEGYRNPLCRTLDRFGIPYHFDVSDTLECSPVTSFLDAAIELAGGMKTGALLRLLKTGVCGPDGEGISLLENYCFVHSVEGSDWYSPFDLNPSGFGEMREGDRETLERTEDVRSRVMAWAGEYASSSRGLKGAALLKKAYALMEKCGAADRIEEQSAPGRRDAGLAFAMTDRLYRLLGNEEIGRDELRSMLKLLACSTKAAEIPSFMDCVMVCDAARSIPYNPRAMFVLGLNEGSFPRDEFSGLIFTLEERDLLLENDIRLAGCFDECADMESFYLYRAVTAPSERLYLGCADGNGSETLKPSAELEGYVREFKPEHLEKDPCGGAVNAATVQDAFVNALSGKDGALAGAVRRSSAGEACEALERKMGDEEFVLERKENARALAGEEMRLSASRLEDFSKCRLHYFLNYSANIRPLEKAELSPLEVGNFIHAVMEKLLQRCGGDLTALSGEEISAAVKELAWEYCESRIDEKHRTPRMLSLVRKISGGAVRLALRLRAEQEQSDFRVDACELQIGGRDPDVAGVVYPLPDGAKAVLEGKIDRVDKLVRDGECYVRVVDYKTGTKDFKLGEVLQGLNTQMLLYLFALRKNGEERYGGKVIPAGVLYMPGDPSPGADAGEADAIYCMKGVVNDEPDVLEAMEHGGSGVFIQPKKDGNGEWGPAANLLSADLFGKLEERMDGMVEEMAVSVRNGDISAGPVAKANGEPIPCKYCEYKAVCRLDRMSTEKYRLLRSIKDPAAELRGEGEDA